MAVVARGRHVLLHFARRVPQDYGYPVGREPVRSYTPAGYRDYASFAQTETYARLSLVKGSRRQPLQRSRSRMPAIRAIRSSSDGQT